MLCEILVRAAQFEVAVVATRELLFQNEIYQAGHQQRLQEQASFLLLDCDVHSHGQASTWAAQQTQRLQARLADLMRPTLHGMGWEIQWVNARDQEQWQIVLFEPNGAARQDPSLILLPRA